MNFVRSILHWRRHEPDRVALASKSHDLTYAHLWRKAGRWADELQRLGVREGDVVSVISENTVETAALLVGCLRIAAIYAPLNYRLTNREIDQVLTDICPKVLFVSDEQFDGRSSVAHNIRPLNVATGVGIEAEAPPGEWVAVDSASPAVILFTSGTTGLPKGATISHGNLWANAANVALSQGLSCADRAYIALPLYHTAALLLQLTPHWYVGGAGLLRASWDPEDAAQAFNSQDATTSFLLPRQWGDVLDCATAKSSGPRFAVTGGEKIPKPVIREMRNAWGIVPAFAMGMTEVSAQPLFTPPSRIEDKNGALGRPTVWSDVRILDDRGRDVPDGQVGEMAFRGPLVMTGYWGDQPRNADDYFLGGDLVRRDVEGWITLVDRKKNIIRSGGETVYSAEVEATIADHESVEDVAVIGAPHERWGEGVTAIVVTKPGKELSLHDLQQHCADRLAGYKKPVRLEVVDALPKNSTGKTRKGELRDWFS